MIDFETKEIRERRKKITYNADFDVRLTFYYDETNNPRKFSLKKEGFNSDFISNFVLGGLVHEGKAPNVQDFIDSLNLQRNIKEIKFKHIAKGNFLDCLRSDKLKLYLDFIKGSNLYVHYSNINILYWSIVDIVDSVFADYEKIDPTLVNYIKNELYKFSMSNIREIHDLFFKFGYPNIKSNQMVAFVVSLIGLFDNYNDNNQENFGLEYLRQMLKEIGENDSLPFIMNEEDCTLIKNFSQFYLRPIYLFLNSNHIFDNEDTIIEILKGYRLLSEGEEIKNYSFVDSKSNQLIQLSDVFVGLFGKLKTYLNIQSKNDLNNDLKSLDDNQKESLNSLFYIIYRSEKKNVGFLHNIEGLGEIEKMNIIFKFLY